MVVEKLLKVALLGASWVMYLMLVLSVFSIGAMVERWWYFAKRNVDADELEEKLLKSLGDGDREGASKLLESSKARSFEAEALAPAMRYLDAGAEAFGDCVDGELIKVRQELERGSNLLGTLGNNAPFIGLLGTVIGVIIAFNQLGSSQAAASMNAVMGGIAEALVSTAVGLFVALPAVVAYNIIQKKIGDIESNVTAITKQVSAFLKAYPFSRQRDSETEERHSHRPFSVVEGHG
ncbi:MAG: MotA/TolQ/ExbB proton channel family protein [Polyangiaceae bacterium]